MGRGSGLRAGGAEGAGAAGGGGDREGREGGARGGAAARPVGGCPEGEIRVFRGSADSSPSRLSFQVVTRV